MLKFTEILVHFFYGLLDICQYVSLVYVSCVGVYAYRVFLACLIHMFSCTSGEIYARRMLYFSPYVLFWNKMFCF